jgi:hypothetical protein
VGCRPAGELQHDGVLHEGSAWGGAGDLRKGSRPRRARRVFIDCSAVLARGNRGLPQMPRRAIVGTSVQLRLGSSGIRATSA